MIAQNVSLDEDVYEMSPFEVSVEDNESYLATSTLAGSRTNTDLKDIANSLDVFTEELMQDMAIDDVQGLTALANNVETNEAGWANGDGQEREVWNYNYMQIRGFKVGTATRNFMNMQTSFEAYNSERATFSKGPNAVLYGLGDPGGSKSEAKRS